MILGDEQAASSVSGDAFRTALAPTRQALRDLCAAVTNVVTSRTLPAADSRAMAELSAEPMWAARSDWEHPISDTHTLGAMTLLACTDCARGFAQTIDADEASMYGHLVLARSALETAVICGWLNDPRIDTAERVRRGLCEQLYSAMEVQRLKIKDDAKVRVAEWKTIADSLDLTVDTRPGKPVISERTARPSIPKGIDELVLGDGDWSLGRIQWSFLSAVSHGTWYGLMHAFQTVADTSPDGIATVAYGASSDSINTHAACVLGALSNTAHRRFTLMGWTNPEWSTARKDAQRAQAGLLRIQSRG
jgi:hypothetical protein